MANARADTIELCLARLKACHIPAQRHRLGENDHHRPLRPERAIYIQVRAGFEIRLAYKTIAKIPSILKILKSCQKFSCLVSFFPAILS
jgi:hypothetical protein